MSEITPRNKLLELFMSRVIPFNTFQKLDPKFLKNDIPLSSQLICGESYNCDSFKECDLIEKKLRYLLDNGNKFDEEKITFHCCECPNIIQMFVNSKQVRKHLNDKDEKGETALFRHKKNLFGLQYCDFKEYENIFKSQQCVNLLEKYGALSPVNKYDRTPEDEVNFMIQTRKKFPERPPSGT